ncbi:MAG: ATP-NAD kinase family protein [Alcanivoracaceae bacterium]|nr:ATP-NAD kinase family protein [Alcanivoracaceae bacterium]
MTLSLGLIVNPMAGVGGSVALKGSDGVAEEALRRGAVAQAGARASRALAGLPGPLTIATWGGDMGENSVRAAGHEPRVLGSPGARTSDADTCQAARALVAAGVDLLVFAGGDGTARDLVDSIGTEVPVLGIPAGCKMHSAVYAINPEAAGSLLAALLRGDYVAVGEADVRDIDEQAFREGVVRARHYGVLRVPGEARFVQQVKCGGREVEDLVNTEIAAWVVDTMEEGVSYLMGSGSTVALVMAQLGLDNTLLGVDWVRDGELLGRDLMASEVERVISDGPARAVVSVIGGQGHVFGRGNQQFSATAIRALGLSNVMILASRTKLATLDGRPLLVDIGDADLDRSLAGLVQVTSGYDDQLLYRLAADAGDQP